METVSRILGAVSVGHVILSISSSSGGRNFGWKRRGSHSCEDHELNAKMELEHADTRYLKDFASRVASRTTEDSRTRRKSMINARNMKPKTATIVSDDNLGGLPISKAYSAVLEVVIYSLRELGFPGAIRTLEWSSRHPLLNFKPPGLAVADRNRQLVYDICQNVVDVPMEHKGYCITQVMNYDNPTMKKPRSVLALKGIGGAIRIRKSRFIVVEGTMSRERDSFRGDG